MRMYVFFLLVFILGIFLITNLRKFPIPSFSPKKIEIQNISSNDPRLFSDLQKGLVGTQTTKGNAYTDYIVDALFTKAEAFVLDNKKIIILTLVQNIQPAKKEFTIAIPEDLESFGSKKIKPSFFVGKKYQRIQMRIRYKTNTVSSNTLFSLEQLLQWEVLTVYVNNENEIFQRIQ